MKKLFFFSFILILLSACKSVATPENTIPTETPLPQMATATDMPAPFPTFTPANTLPPPELSGFPYSAELNDALPKDGLILAMHFHADTVGYIQGDEYCYDVGIYDDDTYIVISCLQDFTYPAPNGTLDANQSKYLLRWMERFQSFEDPSIHGLVRFEGFGEVIPDYTDKISMQAMIAEIEWAAHAYVHRGGYPPVVFHTREVLSHRLNKWLDDSSMLNFAAVDFPDTCLGVPKSDEICEQVITQGFRIQFVVAGLLYEYHTDAFGYDIRSFGEPQVAPTQGAVG